MTDITKETLIKIIADEMNLTIGETRELITKLAEYVRDKGKVI
jgi:nucleoid DNA-binding protein